MLKDILNITLYVKNTWQVCAGYDQSMSSKESVLAYSMAVIWHLQYKQPNTSTSSHHPGLKKNCRNG